MATVDPQTRHAIDVLSRVAVTSHDRRARRAIDHLRRALGWHRDVEPSRCVIVPVRAAEHVDEARESTAFDDNWSEVTTAALEAAIRAGTGCDLINCAPAEPLPRQAQIVTEAIAEARRAGLRLPPITIEWRDGRSEITAGAARWEKAAGRFVMTLSVNAFPEALRETAFHELQHLADFHSGRTFSRVQLEQRALRFASRLAQGICGG